MRDIVSSKEVCGGRPRFDGTRIRIQDILELLANKLSFDEIIEEFPQLSEEDIISAIKYAEKRVSHAVLG